jgi:ketosteroid isomerase-like protein
MLSRRGPEVIIAEYDIEGEIKDGDPFVFSYVLVLRVRDGQIVELRDYLNPLAMTEAARGTTLMDD